MNFQRWIVLCLVLACLEGRAEGNLDPRDLSRDGIMAIGALGNLALLTAIFFKAATDNDEQQIDSSPWVPNYDLSPSGHEMLLFNKLDDLQPAFTYPRSLKVFSRRFVESRLSLSTRETEEGLSPFATELLSYLRQNSKERSELPLYPFLQAGFTSKYLRVSSPSRTIPNSAGVLNPLLFQEEGKFTDDGNLGWLGINLRGALTSWLSYELVPLQLFSTNETPTQQSREIYLERAYAKLTLRRLDIEVGKNNVQWGYGPQGSMLFSGNTESFYFLSAANNQPVTLEGILANLGAVRAQWFATFMDEAQVLPHSILVGSRVAFLPLPIWEFGVSTAVQFGGEGSGTWNPLNYFGESWTGNKYGAGNRAFSVDTRVRIKELRVEPYLELYYEDCCTNVPLSPRDSMRALGLYFPNVTGEGRLDYSLEWVRTTDLTYRHASLASGFFYKRHGFGHPIGPDGDAVYHHFRYFFSPMLVGKLSAAQEWRRPADGSNHEPNNEHRYRVTANLQGEVFPYLSGGLTLGWEFIQGFNFEPGRDLHNYLVGAQLSTPL